MRVLLSTIGSRGDVQPLVALALQLRALGQEVRLCVPPDFRDWIESLGHPGHAHRTRAALDRESQPIGRPAHARAAASDDGSHGRHPVRDDHGGSPGLRHHRGGDGPADRRSLGGGEDGHPVRLRRLLPERAAIATPRAACPLPLPGQTPATAAPADNRELWAQDAERFNDSFGAALNSHRAALGLAPVSDVRSHIFTDRPWLAADPTLAPWPDPADRPCFRPAPGSCRMSVHCPRSWRRSSRPASHPSTSASAACARRKTSAR